MDAHEAIRRGVEAAQAGNQPTAHYYFYQATQADPNDEQAWLWRASAAARPEEALNSLVAVLAINPDNPVARHGLEQISAAISAAHDQHPATITPSAVVQAEAFQPPERRLPWQQAFQRDHYDTGRVAHLGPAVYNRAGAAIEDGTGDAAPPRQGALSAPRPASAAPEENRAMERTAQRRQIMLATIVPVVVVLAAVYLFGLAQFQAPGAAPATPRPALSPTVPRPQPSPSTVLVVAPTAVPDNPTPVPPPPLVTDTVQVPLPATEPPAPPTEAPAPPSSDGSTYTVRDGETLQDIARRLGRTLAAMMVFNNLTHPFDIAVGRTLKVPPADYAPAEVRHIVQPGETLIGIAELYGASADAIVAHNALANPSQVFAGQLLVIPLP